MSPIRITIGLLAAGLFLAERLCYFRPEDQVMDVYRALYPGGDFTDALELETFAGKLKKWYGIDIAPSWREDITLGEIYQAAHESV